MIVRVMDWILTGLVVFLLFVLTLVGARPAAYPVPKMGSCPSGFRESGGYCAPLTPLSPNAVPKGIGQCPSGWMQSGSYCILIEPRRSDGSNR